MKQLSEPEPTKRPPRLLDQVRQETQARHYSRNTRRAYVDWICRFILFNERRHSADLGEPEVNRFPTHLAVERLVSGCRSNRRILLPGWQLICS